MIYRLGESRDLAQLKKIWVECMDESAKAFRMFIKNNQKIMRFYVACDDTKIVAVIYHICCSISGQPGHYLFGASTIPDYRERGIMRHLIEYSVNDAMVMGDKFSAVYPKTIRLEKFFSKLDYTTDCLRKTAKVTKDELMHVAEYAGFSLSMGQSGINKVRKAELKLNAIQFPDEYVKYSTALTKKKGGYINCGSDGYALIEEDKYGECKVSEILSDEKNIYPTLGHMLNNSDAEKFVFNYPVSISLFDNEEIVKDGMIRLLSDFKLNDSYLGLRNK